MAAKNDNILKDPKAAGRKGGANKKGSKHKRTLVREKLGLSWNDAEALVEENIIEFLSSGSKKERMWATRYLAEFAKPKKKEIKGDLNLTIEDIIDDD